MQKCKWEQMVSIKTIIYKESNAKNILNLIFTTLLFLESLVNCKIKKDFNFGSDHELFLSE